MATNGWNKYNRFKAIGGITKKQKDKAQREIIEIVKADEQHNFVTLTEKLTSLEERIGRIEKQNKALLVFITENNANAAELINLRKELGN